MQKEKFITVMAVLDDETQKLLQNIQTALEQQYGADMKTKGIHFHITLGSYAPEDTEEITARIIEVASKTKTVPVEFTGLRHFNNVVRYIDPVISDDLFGLHKHFDSDYANGYPGWMPHVTIYRHSEPTDIELSAEITDMLAKLTNSKIVGIELGEFFPPKKIINVLFEADK